jgi:predicted nucleic acid-binding protein
MARVLIDTNILIYAIDHESQFYDSVFNLFQKIDDGEVEAFISERSLYELLAVFSSPVFASKIDPEKIKEYLLYLTSSTFTILYTNEQITKLVWRLFFNLPVRKNRIYDLVLAATAIENELDVIYTKNVKDFENILEVKVVDPTV